ncbi:hypothetical protein I5M32_05775 [Pedobacter sp. SD-b]|uniref:SPASM domain peptide maturase, grasp-with-spasm system n=1 Tax=Pedobacter segetis TaxID=2793069 RepID=A0ABS1BHX0_9SPHI|nr:hypothetical protein [Pedobacter segetis]MBK0382465.1 hypothetical protein [Pedobacter segetis]
MNLFPSHCVVNGFRNTVIQNLVQGKFEVVNNEDLKIHLLPELPFLINIPSPTYDIYESPSIITNAIIEVSISNNLIKKKNLNLLLNILEGCLCKHIVVRFTTFIDNHRLLILFKEFKKYNIHSVCILLNYHKEYYNNDFANAIKYSGCIYTCIFFKSPFEKNLENLIHFTKSEYKITYNKVLTEFNSNIPLYLEAQKFNTYFNKKVFISETGQIKNAPECSQSFGNVTNLKSLNDLKEIVEDTEFQRFWKVKKDSCDICQDCEFRYMCVDNRIPIIRDDRTAYFEKECNYNPYINKWRGEENYLSLADLGIFLNNSNS